MNEREDAGKAKGTFLSWGLFYREVYTRWAIALWYQEGAPSVERVIMPDGTFGPLQSLQGSRIMMTLEV